MSKRYAALVAIALMSLGMILIRLVSAAAAPDTLPSPIPMQVGAQPVPPYIGAPVSASTLAATPAPQSSFMAANGVNGIHLDSFPVAQGGPLGNAPTVTSNNLGCISTPTLTKAGKVIGICVPPFNQQGKSQPVLYLLEPDTLNTITTLNLPILTSASGSSFGGGGYFYLDQDQNVIFPTGDNTIWEVEIQNGNSFVHTQTCQLHLPSNQVIQSVFPDNTGLLWFTSSGGLVGTASTVANLDVCEPHTMQLIIPDGPDQGKPEPISKSFATDPTEAGGVFIVSNYAMYRFDPEPDGSPSITWREAYDRGTKQKPGQVQQGSGTTPTLIGTNFVTITDNADPQMHVVVYRRAAAVQGSRVVCTVPVFPDDQSATENSLIGIQGSSQISIIVENNFGYVGPEADINGASTTPGITRIDLNPDGSNCHAVWTNSELSVPTVVSQVALGTGLLYTYFKNASPSTTDPWYFGAVDFNTGQTAWQVLAGTGVAYHSSYSGIAMGPDGRTVYTGALGGVVGMTDSSPSPGASATASNSKSSGIAGKTVDGGTLTVSNTSGMTETFSSVTLDVSTPGLFTKMTLTGTVEGGSAETAATGPTQKHLVAFAFSPMLSVPAGSSVVFSLTARLNATAQAEGTIRYAGMVASGNMPIGIVVGILGVSLLGIPMGSWRRRVMLGAAIVLMMAATQVGCGNLSTSRGTIGKSTQTVPVGGVEATNTAGGVVVDGLPATMSLIKLKS